MSIQEEFWSKEYADEYIERNSNFDINSGVEAWSKILKNTHGINSLLECGCNIGRNIELLNHYLPDTKKSIIELSPTPYEIVTKKYNFEHSVNSSILEADLPNNYFDLVFTTGVLIHIHPDKLLENMQKMYDLSKKYIVFGEIFSRVPGHVHYRGRDDLLFKRDFGRFFLENFNCKPIDYGFLWGHYYDDAGFDDSTYWVFEKI